jgi:anti-sigma factor RsiW
MSHPNNERLNDFADGLLPEGETREVALHVASCVACRREVEWIRALKAEAAEHKVDVEPGRDLWPRIEAGIQASARKPMADLTRWRKDRQVDTRRARPWARPSLLAAASLVLLLMGTGIGVVITRGGAGGPPPSIQVAENDVAEDPALRFASAAREVEEAYEPGIRELRELLEAGRDELSPETVEILETSLRLIDEAIREAREALEADAGTPGALRALNSMYETKLQVLRQAAGLTRGA